MGIQLEQIKVIHALLSKEVISDKDLKASIIVKYTLNSKKSSTKDLSFEQANDLISDLGGQPFYNEFTRYDFNKKSHRYILSILQTAGWTVYNAKSGRFVADMARFAGFLKSKKSPIKKPLTKQNKEEISKTITALEGVLQSELSK